MSRVFSHAVIGHTGFVGSALMRSMPGAIGFNSRTVGDAHGASFSTLYCAAAPGSMLKANRNPEEDAARVGAVIDSLRAIRADRFVLISTIAVLEHFDGGYTERDEKFQTATPYGLHRRRLELACREIFPDCLIVRLPALFGPGLAKNFIFDMMNPMPTMLNAAAFEKLESGGSRRLKDRLQDVYSLDEDLGMHVIDRVAFNASPERRALEAEADQLGVNAVLFHNRDTTYQFYDISGLARDIRTALDAELECVHLAPAPLRAADIHAELKQADMPTSDAQLHKEDMRTLHATLWGCDGPYIHGPRDTLKAVGQFFRAETKG